MWPAWLIDFAAAVSGQTQSKAHQRAYQIQHGEYVRGQNAEGKSLAEWEGHEWPHVNQEEGAKAGEGYQPNITAINC